jgi:hypothetical protein
VPEVRRPESVVRLGRIGGLAVVSVRPCPDDIPALKSFPTFVEAEAYAVALAAERGWRLVEARP